MFPTFGSLCEWLAMFEQLRLVKLDTTPAPFCGSIGFPFAPFEQISPPANKTRTLAKINTVTSSLSFRGDNMNFWLGRCYMVVYYKLVCFILLVEFMFSTWTLKNKITSKMIQFVKLIGKSFLCWLWKLVEIQSNLCSYKIICNRFLNCTDFSTYENIHEKKNLNIRGFLLDFQIL